MAHFQHPWLIEPVSSRLAMSVRGPDIYQCTFQNIFNWDPHFLFDGLLCLASAESLWRIRPAIPGMSLMDGLHQYRLLASNIRTSYPHNL
jgi:hypothetical protein